MNAVLLAAGKGVRLRPYTFTSPKPLLLVGKKTILQYVLDALPNEIDHIYLVVNHLRDQIMAFVGDQYHSIPVTYVIQEPLTGTAGALYLLKEQLQDRFLVINADNIYDSNSIARLLNFEQSLLVTEVPTPLQAGVHEQDNCFVGLRACLQPPCLMVCGAYLLNPSFFDLIPQEICVGFHKEFGLPQTLAQTSQPIHLVRTTFWFPIGTQQEYQTCTMKLSRQKEG